MNGYSINIGDKFYNVHINQIISTQEPVCIANHLIIKSDLALISGREGPSPKKSNKATKPSLGSDLETNSSKVESAPKSVGRSETVLIKLVN